MSEYGSTTYYITGKMANQEKKEYLIQDPSLSIGPVTPEAEVYFPDRQ